MTNNSNQAHQTCALDLAHSSRSDEAVGVINLLTLLRGGRSCQLAVLRQQDVRMIRHEDNSNAQFVTNQLG